MKNPEENYEYAVTAAGRVNIIGEHIDYCGGKVLPAALSLGNTVYIRKNESNKINLSWTSLPEKISLDLNDLERYKGVKYADYFAACASVLQKEGRKLVGCDVLSDCRVPFGSGLSSSAAIEVSFISALLTLLGEPLNKAAIALAAHRAEHEYVGMNCGVMDQYASACGKKGQAMLLDCATLSCEYIPVELGEYVFVIANSNKPHNLVVSKYNERRQESEEALALIREKLPITHLSEVTPETFADAAKDLPPILRMRARHVAYETDRVKQAVQAMRAGDMQSLGALLRASHASLRDLYEVTGKELDALAEAANDSPYCAGSRMTGGGFGGSTVSLVKKENVAAFEEEVYKKYLAAIGYAPTFYPVDVSEGITVKRI